MYARFRKRITFPIANEQGKTIAFTARALEDVDDKGRPIAKYMNSPETPLFTKGQVLFNLDKAKAAHARARLRSSSSKARWTASPSTWPG